MAGTLKFAVVASGIMLATGANAGENTDYPHRDWGKIATLDMTLDEATTCIARELARKGDVVVLPVDSGSDIDFAVRPIWGPKMEPWETFKIRQEAGATTLRLFYRHPVTRKGAGKDVVRLQKRCLKVRSIDPN